MELKLRPGLHYAPLPGGVYFGNGTTKFVVNGPAALSTVADVCVPLLERGTSEEELVGALGNESALPIVRYLVKTLDAKGVMLPLDKLTVSPPDPEVYERYTAVLQYLESRSEDPYRAFEILRHATVVLHGSGAAVLPAARGLAAAGVSDIVLSTPDVAQAAATVRRLPEVSMQKLPARADAVVVVGEAPGPLPESTLRIPVRVGDVVATVGPAGGDGTELAERAALWGDPADPIAEPTALALAGALAGQLVLDELAGLAEPGTAYVLSGRTLAMDTVHLAAPGSARVVPVQLTPSTGTDLPSATDAVARMEAVTARWTGLVESVTPPDLPQLPIALSGARAVGGELVVRWAGDTSAATVEAGLAAFRAHFPAGDGVAAAGLTLDRWLLDGALQLLADVAEPGAGVEYADVTEGNTRRLWRTLEDHELVPVRVRLGHVAGLGWMLATLLDARDGSVLSSGWGATTTQAVFAAVGDGLARMQVRRVYGSDLFGRTVATSALNEADATTVGELVTQVVKVCAQRGQRLVGWRVAADELIGEIGLSFGRVGFDG
ncbi:hypothetical protein GCM10012275_35060 [Longimycelium tulufanense]|uniref:Uncharacterized protein n=1 Tax=Longimycelium tulufanense TaxID=907463 RepID=A0A8J3FWM5_9PSEU|nr:hypothetical protein [Longimycelium tulufanense]GGM60995.1 hypothetical protein GCM10012275_35060 [Longimycelium tulufanense]